MAADVCDETIVDVVGEESLFTNTVTVKVPSVPKVSHLFNCLPSFRIFLSEP